MFDKHMSGGGQIYRDYYGDSFDPYERVTAKELAPRIHRSPWYVYGMMAAGFADPLHVGSYDEAINWLRENVNFSAKRSHAFRANKNRKKKALA